MNDAKVQFEAVWPLLLTIPCVACVWFSCRRLRGLGKAWRVYVLPFLLRALCVILCALILCEVTITTGNVGAELWILQDVSASMNGADAEAALQTLRGAKGYARVQTLPFAGAASETGAPDAAATHIAEALASAEAQCDPNRKLHIALLSDGLETGGDAREAAARIANRGGARIDALHFAAQTPETEIEAYSLEVPSEIKLGQSCKLIVRVRNGGGEAVDMRIKLTDNGTVIEYKHVVAKPGDNAYSFSLSPKTGGAHAYTAVCEPERDTIAENNACFGCMNTAAGDTVLIVDGTGESGHALHAFLSANGYDAVLSPVADIPKSVVGFNEYGLVILANVDAQDLISTTSAALIDYVEKYGRGLLTLGGENTYAFGHMDTAAFRRLLPVLTTAPDKTSDNAIAMYLLIDNSASMSVTFTSLLDATDSPIAAVKLGAINCIEQMNEHDYIGILTFSESTNVVSELTSAANKDEIIPAIARMGTIGGTVYTGALTRALEDLRAFEGAQNKHVLLLSDGNPSDEGYEDIVRQMREAGITLSAICVGKESNDRLLRELAELGGGTCTILNNIEDLPDIMIADTVVYRTEYAETGAFAPAAASVAAEMGFPDQNLPALNGFVATTLQRGATLIYSAPEGYPLYAQWKRGKGRVGAFTGSLDAPWSGDWLSDAKGRAATMSIMQALMPDASEGGTLDASITSDGADCTLKVLCRDADDGARYTVDITAPDGGTAAKELLRLRSGVYGCSFPLSGYGVYSLVMRVYDREGRLIGSERAYAPVSWSSEYEAFPAADGAALLGDVCALAGGTVARDAETLLNGADLDALRVAYSPVAPLCALAAVCFLFDLLLRRMRGRTK